MKKSSTAMQQKFSLEEIFAIHNDSISPALQTYCRRIFSNLQQETTERVWLLKINKEVGLNIQPKSSTSSIAEEIVEENEKD